MTQVRCSVCSKLYDGTTHCSVTVCRACSIFFKRSENWIKLPICKGGNNNCNLNDAGQIFCTACRYEKCVEVGLKPVEKIRGSKSDKLKLRDYSSTERNFIKLNFDMPVLVLETMPTLKRFCYYYSVNCNIKKEHELQLLQKENVELTQLPGNRRMYRITRSLCSKLWENSPPDFINFLNSSFPAVSTIDSSSQDQMIHLLMFHFFDLYSSFKTLRVFNDVNTTKIICSEAMFSDFDDLSNYMDKNLQLDPMDNKTIVEFISVSWRSYFNKTLKLLHTMQITDVEYLVVSALIIWEEENFKHLPQLSKMAEVYRNLVYKDLDHYYKKILHLDNYVERVMNIKELLKTLKKNLHFISENIHFLRTFNFYKGNEQEWRTTEKVINIVRNQFEE